MLRDMKHPLQRYFEKFPDETRKNFAKRAGISRMQLWRLMNSEGEFSTTCLKRVSRATDGLVSVTDLVGALAHKVKRKKVTRTPEVTEAA